MPVDLMKSAVAGGVGVLDEFMVSWDEKEGRTESFKNATDISRLLVAGLGYGLQVFYPRQARIGEALALSGTTLLVKSISKPLRSALGGGTAAYVPRVSVPAYQPAVQPRMQSPQGITREYQPEFNTAKAL